MTGILSTRAVSKRFGEVVALDAVSLDIRDGEFFTIVGPSGSGKSTFLRILAGLETPDSGRVHLREADITEAPANRRPTCMVFQNLALFSHRTVGENIEFSGKMKGVPRPERRAHAERMMRIVRLPESYYSPPGHSLFRRRATAGGACPRARVGPGDSLLRRAPVIHRLPAQEDP